MRNLWLIRGDSMFNKRANNMGKDTENLRSTHFVDSAWRSRLRGLYSI